MGRALNDGGMLTHCDVSATVSILTAKIDGSRQQTAAVFAEDCAGRESSANLDSPDKFARQKKNTALANQNDGHFWLVDTLNGL